MDRLFASIDQVLASGGGGHAAGPMPGAGPVPGWYPDLRRRHQSRYWDGALWTEHVAGNGTTGVDPV